MGQFLCIFCQKWASIQPILVLSAREAWSYFTWKVKIAMKLIVLKLKLKVAKDRQNMSKNHRRRRTFLSFVSLTQNKIFIVILSYSSSQTHRIEQIRVINEVFIVVFLYKIYKIFPIGSYVKLKIGNSVSLKPYVRGNFG